MAESLAWRVKVRLQWTGWLQYIPTVVIALFSLGLARLGALVVGEALVYPFSLLAEVLGVLTLFDLATNKCGLRPWEPSRSRRLDDLDAFDLMRGRRSCRSFQTRNLTAADLGELMDCVKQETVRSKLLGSCPIRFEYISEPLTVWPVVGAHEFLVALAPAEYSRAAVVDVGRCLQKVVLHATRMGLGTCWIGPGADHRSVIHNLGDRFDPDRDHIICVCAIGYASVYMPTFVRVMSRAMRRRFPLRSLFFADAGFQEPLDVSRYPFSRYGRCYEGCQWSPSSFNAQPVRCVADSSGRSFDFYAATASRFYVPVALGIWLANWETGCDALGIRGHFERLPPKEQAPGSGGAAASGGADHGGPIYDCTWLTDEG